jgi:uroporphyrinogen-III synthase
LLNGARARRILVQRPMGSDFVVWTSSETVDTFAKLLLEQEGVLWVRHVVNIRMNLSGRLWSFW